MLLCIWHAVPHHYLCPLVGLVTCELLTEVAGGRGSWVEEKEIGGSGEGDEIERGEGEG